MLCIFRVGFCVSCLFKCDECSVCRLGIYWLVLGVLEFRSFVGCDMGIGCFRCVAHLGCNESWVRSGLGRVGCF